MVERMRDDRGALVQHDAQLVYLHRAVTEFAIKAEQGAAVAAVEDDFEKEIEVDGVVFRFTDLDGDGTMSLEEVRARCVVVDHALRACACLSCARGARWEGALCPSGQADGRRGDLIQILSEDGNSLIVCRCREAPTEFRGHYAGDFNR